jgi:hypothetical protein
MQTKKARMGRPPKSPAEKQSKAVMIMLTPGEHRQLKAAARKAGLPLATYIMTAWREAKGG